LDFPEKNTVAVGTGFLPTEQPIILINDSERESESDDSLPGDSYIFSIPIEDIGIAQKLCPQLGPVINYLTTGSDFSDPVDQKSLYNYINTFHQGSMIAICYHTTRE